MPKLMPFTFGSSAHYNPTLKSLSIGAQDHQEDINGTTFTGRLIGWCDNGQATCAEVGLGRAENTSATVGATIFGARSRGTLATKTAVQDGDNLFDVVALGHDGTDYVIAARVDMEVDGTPGDNDMPGRIVFRTTPDGASAATESMRISADKSVTITNCGTFDADGIDLLTGNGYEINNTSVLNATTLGSGVVNSSLTSLGTVISGTLSTGAALADVTMSLGSDADGDIYYRSSNKLTRLPKGTASQVLTMNGGATAPEWAAASGGGDFSNGGDAGGAARSLGNTDAYDLHFVTNNTDRLHITSTGKISTGAETSPDCSAGGVCIVPADATSHALSIKDVGVGHGLTKYAETDTYYTVGELTDNAGGVVTSSFTDGDETFSIGHSFRTFLRDTADTTTTTAGLGMFTFYAWQHDGANSESAPAADGNMFVIRSGATTRFIVKGDGDVEADGTVTSNSYDFAEYIESLDGNPIDAGIPVIFVGKKIRPALVGEIPDGVISATAGYIGNGGLEWHGKYVKDKKGKKLKDTDGNYIVSPEYDPEQEFIHRKDRPEWCVMGMLGQVYIKKGSPLDPRWKLIEESNDEYDLYFIK